MIKPSQALLLLLLLAPASARAQTPPAVVSAGQVAEGVQAINGGPELGACDLESPAAELQATIDEWVENDLEALPVRGLLSPEAEAILSNVEGAHFWDYVGRKDLADRARAQARALAETAGVDVEQALSHAVAWSRVGGPSIARVDGKRRTQGFGKALSKTFTRARAYKTDAWPEDATRRLGAPNQYWWPGYQTAYLDLAYRVLPEMLRAHVHDKPGQPFRIWHAAYEDGSQTFLLAAMIDEAIERLSAREPALADALDQLRVEIVATDLTYALPRHDNTVRFDVDYEKVRDVFKSTVVLEELGPAETRAAGAEIRRLEAALPADGHASLEQLEALADAGKVPQLLGRVLRAAPAINLRGDWFLYDKPSGYGRLFPHVQYEIAADNWTITDEQGRLPHSNGRHTMRFELGDMTKTAPAGQFQLIVVTNVLPHIKLYDAELGQEHGEHPMDDALAFLKNALAPGSAMVIDVPTEEHMEADWLQSVRDAGAQVWSTTSTGLLPADPETARKAEEFRY